MKKNIISNLIFLCLGLTLISALIIRLNLILSLPLWLDEACIFFTSQKKAIDLLLLRHYDASHPPLYFLLIHFWQKINTQPFFLRLPSLFFSIASIILVYLIGKKLKDKHFGLISALIISFYNFHINFSWQIRPYALVVFLVFFSVYNLINLLTSNKAKWLYLFVLSNVLAFYTDYSFIWYYFSLVISLGCLFLWKEKFNNLQFKNLLKGLLISFFFMAPWMFIFFKRLPEALELEEYIKITVEKINYDFLNILGLSFEKQFLAYFFALLSFLGIFIKRDVFKNKVNFFFDSILIIFAFFPPLGSLLFSLFYSPIFLAKNVWIVSLICIFGFAKLIDKLTYFSRFLSFILLIGWIFTSLSVSPQAATYSTAPSERDFGKIRNIMLNHDEKHNLIVFFGEDYEEMTLEYYLLGFDGTKLKDFRIMTFTPQENLVYYKEIAQKNVLSETTDPYTKIWLIDFDKQIPQQIITDMARGFNCNKRSMNNPLFRAGGVKLFLCR